MEISQLKEANQRLWMMILLAISFAVIFIIVVLMLIQKIRHRKQMKQVDIKLDTLVQKLNESNLENEIRAHEIEEFLSDKEKRRELETLAPHILKESGDVKFRQCFELLFPLFLHRLREKVPTVSRREELLSMLIVLKQDNKEIAELLAVAPRSVLMLRHRFRQKIGLTTENSLESFIDSLLGKH
jgi:DNA-binding CsgD family transcriptional regulator